MIEYRHREDEAVLKLFRYLRAKEIVMFVGLIAFLVVQVFCDVTMPAYTAEIVAKMQAGEEAASILHTGGIMLAFAAGSVAATIAETFLSARISTRLGRRLRGEVFAHVVNFSDKDAGSFSAGSLLTRTTNDVQQVVTAMVLGLRLGIGAPLMAVMAIIRIAQSSGELTIVTVVAVVILLAAIMAILMIVLPRFKLIQKLTDKLNGTMRDTLTASASCAPTTRRTSSACALRRRARRLPKTTCSREGRRRRCRPSCSSSTTG